MSSTGRPPVPHAGGNPPVAPRERRARQSAGGAGSAARASARAGRRQAASERRRRAILKAARTCFGRHGFAGATVETIAAAAGVSNGLLYQFFRNKQHLFEVVVEELFRDWRRALLPGQQEDQPGSRAAALENMFRGSVEFARRHPLLPALLSEDAVLELSRHSDLSARWVEGYRAYVAGILRAGMEEGEFRSDLDAEAVADVVCQLQVDYATRAYRRRPGFPAGPRLVDAAVGMIHEAVRRRA